MNDLSIPFKILCNYPTFAFALKYYPDNIIESLEFDQILSEISDLCAGDLGRKLIQELHPFTGIDIIQKHLELTSNLQEALSDGIQFQLQGYEIIEEHLLLLEKEGSVLMPTAFSEIRFIAKKVAELQRWAKAQDEKYLKLAALIKACPSEKSIVKEIDAVFKPSGEIKDKASNELYVIRTEITDLTRQLTGVFGKELTKYRKQGYLASIEESISGGRKVLAVLSEHKRKVPGIIHGMSETGQTSFIEPQSTLEIANNLLHLEQEEHAEIRRILRELSDVIRPFVPVLYQQEQLIGRLDFTKAKALYAARNNCVAPKLDNAAVVELKEAYHPILKRKNDTQKKKTIPLTISLNGEQRILVISGPNAGGKSVALKTVGLLQLMVQSGIPVPVSPESSMAVFDKIFADIGDEQSIEDELSTYSSKLRHMAHFVVNADDRTLFLIDEFGSGTDPSLGGSVAQAVLENLNAKESFGVITTHYFNLKTYANEAGGIVNGAMLFDEQSLKPLYHLETGKPGSSYTFAVASNSGLSSEIITRAKELSGAEKVELDELISSAQKSKTDLLLKQLELENKLLEYKSKDEQINHLKNRIIELKGELKGLKRAGDYEVKKQVKERFDEYVRKLKKVQNKEKATQDIKSELKQELEADLKKIKSKQKASIKARTSNKPLTVGDEVEWIVNGQTGIVERLMKKKAEIVMGNVRTQISVDELRPVGNSNRRTKSNSSSRGRSHIKEAVEFEKDIRGMRHDEARIALITYFDSAIVNNLSSVSILHGKGSGALRRVVAEVAAMYGVKNVSHPRPELGGDGISIITF